MDLDEVREPPIVLINDHKVGYQITSRLVECYRTALRAASSSSLPDITVRTFTRFWTRHDSSSRYIVCVRDPREIVVSGYLYHRRCDEVWAVRRKRNYYKGWMRHHFLESARREHRAWIEDGDFSRETPYRKQLSLLSVEDGLIHEMTHVARHTIMGLYDYPHFGRPNVFRLRFERLCFDPDACLRDLGAFLSLSAGQVRTLAAAFLPHTPAGLSREARDEHAHITNKANETARHRRYWTARVADAFSRTFPGDVLQRLGY